MKSAVIYLILLLAPLLPAQGLEIDTQSPVVAIGDLHGDLDAFKRILRGMNLIDGDSRWAGGDTILLQLGDVIDRGPQTKSLIDYLIFLERDAARKGGRVISLLGNHEMMVLEGDLRYLNRRDWRSFEGRMDKVLLHREPYASWFRRRPLIVRINDSLFIHGGVDTWAFDHSIADLNKKMQSIVEALQADSTYSWRNAWLLREGGPLWTRVFAPEPQFGELDPEDLQAILRHWGVERVVVGHSIVKPKRSLVHPTFGSSVIRMDTAISRAYGRGRQTALEITGKGVRLYDFTPPSDELACEGGLL